MSKLQIEYIDASELKAYVNNAKIHTGEQIEQIKKSITEFGFNDPIAVWGENEIVEGHGRLIAALELGIKTLPIIRLDDLTDKQRRAYMLVHNKLTMVTGFDLDVLNMELEDLQEFGMEDYGFLDEMYDDFLEDELEIDKYTKNVKIPQYEITGELPEITDLVDSEKTKELIANIESADIPVEIKEFLKTAAYRHNVFNYRNIAEFYAHQTPEIQRLMEESALVIIDVDDAIANGFIKLKSSIQELIEEDEEEEE